MAFPQQTSSNFIVNGNSAAGGNAGVYWGTDGGLYPSRPDAILKSFRRSDMADEVIVENGTGLPAWHILLVSGVEAEMTCIWDSNSGTPPSVGDVLTLLDPESGTSGSFIVVTNPVTLARKEAAEFTCTAKYFTTLAS